MYRLEPTVRDVYTEGKFDQDFLKWFFRRIERAADVQVYNVESIEISAALIESYGLQVGARSRVVCLAHELAKALPRESVQASCVIDADVEAILGKTYECQFLLTTDYPSMELYAFDSRAMGKFLQITLGVHPADLERLMQDYARILVEPFLIYAAARNIGIAWPRFPSRVPLVPSCSRVGQSLAFDADDFLDRFLNKNSAAQLRTAILDSIDALRQTLSPDHRKSIDGHDLIELTAWHWERECRNRGFRDHTSIQHLLMNSVEFEQLLQEPLFKTLLQRIAPGEK